MFRSSSQWQYLHLGSGERWSKVCKVLWIHCRLVVLHGMDDICSWKLPGEHGRASHVYIYLISLSDYCELRSFSTRSMGH